jgi:uncharacterized protein YfeS
MKISVSAQSYDTCGGDPSISPVGEFLTRHVRGVEPADLLVEICACFDTHKRPKRTLETLHANFRSILAELPRVRFEPKRSRVEIRFAVQGWLAEDAMEKRPGNREVFSSMCAPISEALRTTVAGHKKLRAAIALPELSAALDAALASLPASDAAFREFLAQEQARAAAEVAAMSPWDLLDIDWSSYHPDARQHLADPFFWDCVDDYAPHGNDTGADVLEMFRAWRKRNKEKPALQFLPRLMKEWGFDPALRALAVKPLSEWTRDDETALDIQDQAAIALAFAQLKLEASIDSELGAAALASIDRQLDPQVHEHFGWSTPPEREGRLRQMRATLKAVPANASG